MYTIAITLMKELPLMSKYDLYPKLQKRMHDYCQAISPAGDSSMLLSVVTHWHYFEQQLKNLDAQYDLFGKGFWGYGINRIRPINMALKNGEKEKVGILIMQGV